MKPAYLVRLALLCLALLFLVLPFQAEAYDTLVQVHGRLIGNTCTVDTRSKELTVKLGNVASKDFLSAADGKGQTRAVPFSILLTDCQAQASGVKVRFVATADASDDTLIQLAPDGAKGVAIRLLDDEKTPLAINHNSKVYPLDADRLNTLTFYARYVATGQTLTPGAASAVSTFMLEYL